MKNYEMKVYPKKDIDGNVYWTAVFPAIKECIGGGSTIEEAIADAQENLSIYFEYLENEKNPKPPEYIENDYNGKIALRLPRSTHKKVSEMAEIEGVSVNTLLVSAVEHYLGTKRYELSINKKIDDLLAVANQSLMLQQFNVRMNAAFYDQMNPVSKIKIGDR